MFQWLGKKIFGKGDKPAQEENNHIKILYFCPFCCKQLGPTQDCFSCNAKSLNQMFWIDEFPTMGNSSVDTMDLVLWKNGNTEVPRGVAKMLTQKDVPQYYYDENDRKLHEEIHMEYEASYNRLSLFSDKKIPC